MLKLSYALKAAERIYFAFMEFRSGIIADTIVDSPVSSCLEVCTVHDLTLFQEPFFLGGNKLRVAHKTTDNKKHGSPSCGSSPSNKPPTTPRRIEQNPSADSPAACSSTEYPSPTYVSPTYSTPGYGSSAYATPTYGSPGYSMPVYGAQGYTTAYGTPPYNSPQPYYPMGYPQYGYNGYGNFNYCPVPYGTTQGPYPGMLPQSSYPYQTATGVDPQIPVSTDAPGNSTMQPYWVQPSYSYAPTAQAWSPPVAAPEISSPIASSPVTEVTEVSEESEDRSATPTPSRPNPDAEQPNVAQQ